MRSPRIGRLDRAWLAYLPDGIPAPLKFLFFVLLGLTFGIIWWLVLWMGFILRWVFVRLYELGEHTFDSMNLIANDPDRP